jgi:kynurenine formamidase
MRITSIASALLTFVTLGGAAPGDAQERWYPSKYGAEDRLGAINNLSPALVREAAKLVKTGKTYSLGVETGRSTPAFGHRSYQIFTMAVSEEDGAPLGSNEGTYNDDFLNAWLGIGTQIDGLGHFGIAGRYYNGLHASEFLTPTGLSQFGTHALPPIVTRGVLLDLPALRGVPMLPGGSAINRAQLEAAAQRQGITLRKGDVVILHTGWQALAAKDPEAFLAQEPGLGKEGAAYLAGLGVVAVGADSWGVEVLPCEEEGEVFPVHQILLARNGVYVLENIRTQQLAADGVSEFLFVLGQPRFVGAVQMVINPIAIR